MGVIPSIDTATARRVLKKTGGEVGRWIALTEKQRIAYVEKRLDMLSSARQAVKEGRVTFDESGIKDLSRSVLKTRRLIQITPDQSDFVIQQVLKNERVHKAQGLEDLYAHRLGDIGDDTDCQAIVVPTHNGPRILCQIFRYHTRALTDSNGLIYPDTLPGNVDVIKSSRIAPMAHDANVTGYWTISSKFSDSGLALIGDLKRAAGKRFETTISPGHEFSDTYDMDEITKLYNEHGFAAVQNFILHYLQRVVKDPDDSVGSVAKFHFGNGAFLAWIHFNPESEADKVIFSLGYDRKLLASNQTIFKKGAGEIPMSEALHSVLERGRPVKSTSLAPRALAA